MGSWRSQACHRRSYKQTRVVSLHVGLGLALAWIMTKLSADPPLTPAMLGVLDHDDDVDSERALKMLGLDNLTSVDEMLQHVLAVQTK